MKTRYKYFLMKDKSENAYYNLLQSKHSAQELKAFYLHLYIFSKYFR